MNIHWCSSTDTVDHDVYVCVPVTEVFTTAHRYLPQIRRRSSWQQRNHSVTQTLAEWTQELSLLDVVARWTSQTLLTPLLLHLHSLKVSAFKKRTC